MKKPESLKTYSVYVLECSDGTFYTGVTTDVERRAKEHNNSIKGASYTRARRPVVLVYVEVWEGRSQAQIREAEIKTLTRTQKLALIRQGGEVSSLES